MAAGGSTELGPRGPMGPYGPPRALWGPKGGPISLQLVPIFEKVESPKTDSPDLTPEGLGAQGDPKYTLKKMKTMQIRVFGVSGNSHYFPYWALRALASVRRCPMHRPHEAQGPIPRYLLR